jgi:hypothetical protein
MSFELKNDSFTFQNFMNDTLMNYLNEFVVAYLNNNLIYNQIEKNHIKHVKQILTRLREASIQADVAKCEFHKHKIKFLEMRVDRDEIRMNSKKIKINVEWAISRHLKEIQAFFEFVNFYRRFIKNFSKCAKTLINLTKKKQTFDWIRKCQEAFNELKKKWTEAFVLSYFISKFKTFVKNDSSNYVSASE